MSTTSLQTWRLQWEGALEAGNQQDLRLQHPRTPTKKTRKCPVAKLRSASREASTVEIYTLELFRKTRGNSKLQRKTQELSQQSISSVAFHPFYPSSHGSRHAVHWNDLQQHFLQNPNSTMVAWAQQLHRNKICNLIWQAENFQNFISPLRDVWCWPLCYTPILHLNWSMQSQVVSWLIFAWMLLPSILSRHLQQHGNTCLSGHGVVLCHLSSA